MINRNSALKYEQDDQIFVNRTIYQQCEKQDLGNTAQNINLNDQYLVYILHQNLKKYKLEHSSMDFYMPTSFTTPQQKALPKNKFTEQVLTERKMRQQQDVGRKNSLTLLQQLFPYQVDTVNKDSLLNKTLNFSPQKVQQNNQTFYQNQPVPGINNSPLKSGYDIDPTNWNKVGNSTSNQLQSTIMKQNSSQKLSNTQKQQSLFVSKNSEKWNQSFQDNSGQKLKEFRSNSTNNQQESPIKIQISPLNLFNQTHENEQYRARINPIYRKANTTSFRTNETQQPENNMIEGYSFYTTENTNLLTYSNQPKEASYNSQTPVQINLQNGKIPQISPRKKYLYGQLIHENQKNLRADMDSSLKMQKILKMTGFPQGGRLSSNNNYKFDEGNENFRNKLCKTKLEKLRNIQFQIDSMKGVVENMLIQQKRNLQKDNNVDSVRNQWSEYLQQEQILPLSHQGSQQNQFLDQRDQEILERRNRSVADSVNQDHRESVKLIINELNDMDNYQSSKRIHFGNTEFILVPKNKSFQRIGKQEKVFGQETLYQSFFEKQANNSRFQKKMDSIIIPGKINGNSGQQSPFKRYQKQIFPKINSNQKLDLLIESSQIDSWLNDEDEGINNNYKTKESFQILANAAKEF